MQVGNGSTYRMANKTSGGLLMAVAPEDADALIAELQGAVPSVQRIGTVSEYTGGKRILLR